MKGRYLPIVHKGVDKCHLTCYNTGVVSNHGQRLARIIKQQRLSIPLTLRELSARSGVSSSHLGRIEREQRFPSAHILQRIAEPLGFGDVELFRLASYLTPQTPVEAESHESYSQHKGLDPYVARVLGEEPVSVQRAIVGILTILKALAESIEKDTVHQSK